MSWSCGKIYVALHIIYSGDIVDAFLRKGPIFSHLLTDLVGAPTFFDAVLTPSYKAI